MVTNIFYNFPFPLPAALHAVFSCFPRLHTRRAVQHNRYLCRYQSGERIWSDPADQFRYSLTGASESEEHWQRLGSWFLYRTQTQAFKILDQQGGSIYRPDLNLFLYTNKSTRIKDGERTIFVLNCRKLQCNFNL